MRASFPWFGQVPASVMVCVQIALGGLGAAACHDIDSLAPGAGGTLAQTGGAGQGGGTSGGGATATGGDTGATTAMGGTGGASTAGTGSSAMGGTGGAVAQMAPDFSLVDVNPASLSSGQPVSPRDYLLRVSAWYFGHST